MFIVTQETGNMWSVELGCVCYGWVAMGWAVWEAPS